MFFSSYFEIKVVNISGLKTITEENVRQQVNNILGKRNLLIGKLSNYFLFPAELSRAKIQSAFPKIGEVQVEKVYPEVLNISLVEREAIGVWCGNDELGIRNYELGDRCFYFDKQGVIFESSPKSIGSLMLNVEDRQEKEPLLGQAVLNEELIIFFQKAREVTALNFPFSAQTFLVTPQGKYELLTSEGWRVLLHESDSLEYQLSNLKYVLDEKIQKRRRELEYVDLRLGNRVYYKYLGAASDDF